MPNASYQPDAVGDAVMRVLREEGRATPALIGAESEFGRREINNALTDLVAAGWVSKRHRGLYDYVADPRVSDDTEHDERGETPPESGAVSRAREAGVPAEIDALIDAWVPEKQVATDTARTALREAVTWLADHNGPAMKGDFLAGAKPDADTEQTWWKRSARPGLAMLAREGLVERPSDKKYVLETE